MKTACWKARSIPITAIPTRISRNDMEKLEVRNVSKSFDGKSVLEDISIELNRGELVSLLGVSGGGKTTLFNVISGLLQPAKRLMQLPALSQHRCYGYSCEPLFQLYHNILAPLL